jgi:hypothetical protein
MSESKRSDAEQDRPAEVPGHPDRGTSVSPKVQRNDKARPDGEAIGELGDAVGGPA